MATIRFLVPEATRNYIKNPSFRYVADGWTAMGASITRTLEQARFNVASLKIVAAGSAIGEGAYYRVNALAGVSDDATASLYVRGVGAVRVRLTDNASGMEWASKSIALRSDRWQRIEVSGRCSGGDDVRLYVETADRVQAVTFYADGAQIERHPYATTFCDGDQPDCAWTVLEHGSQSYRLFDTRRGGKWLDVTHYHPDLYTTVIGGMGVAPIRSNLQSYADSPGSFYENFKILDRVVTMAFHVKKEALRLRCNVSLDALHNLRQALYNILKPDVTARRQPILMEYNDNGVPVYVWMHYDGGMEGDWDIRNGWVNSFPVRMLAVDPLMFNDTQDVFDLGFLDTATVNKVAARMDGKWGELNGGLNGPIYNFAIGRYGEIIACGDFTRANHKATAIDPDIYASGIAYWDGTQWHDYDGGALDGLINDVAVAPNGDVYATGTFTTIGGVAANRIARWNGSAWVALGTGLGGAGLALAIAPDGNVYVGGTFTTAGGIPAYNIARWDGSSWHFLGAEGGLNNTVRAIVLNKDGTQIFIGGDFTDEYNSPGNLALNYVALYDAFFEVFDEMGDGFDNSVRKMVLSPSGDYLYACGDFVTSGTTGQVLLYVARWNGAQWFEMGSGADDIVRNMDMDAHGNVIAAGDFTRIGSVDANYLALWNGSTWVHLDIDIFESVYAVKFDRYGNIYCGAGDTIEMGALTTVENIGSAETHPVIYMQGPGVLKWIENQTARRRIYLDLELLDDEEVFLDTGSGKMTSAVRGDLAYTVLSGSEMRAWRLSPGENIISVLMLNDVGAVMSLTNQPVHWGADATQEGEL